MKRSRFTDKQIVRILQEADKDAALTIESTMSNMTYSLKCAKELAERIGAQDETVDAALERHLASIDPDYGAAVSAHCLVLERKLLDLYRWRDSRSGRQLS